MTGGPWEQYAAPAAAPAEEGPWSQYKGPAAPAPAATPNGYGAIPVGPGETRPVAPPQAPPTFSDKLTGAVEAGLNFATQMIGGTVGMTAAIPASAISAGGAAVRGLTGGRRLPGPLGVLAGATDRFMTPTEAMGEVGGAVTTQLKRLVSGPMDLSQEQTPDTDLGETYTRHYVEPVMNTLGALGGHVPEVTNIHTLAKPAIDQTAAAVGPKGRAVADVGERAIGAAARKVLPVDPELAKVAQIAGDLKHPIDVRPDQIIENAKFSKLAGQAAADVPLANSKSASNQVAFTRNLIDMLNPEEVKADRLTPDVFDKAMRRSGEGIDEITARTPIPEADLVPGLDHAIDLSKATEDNRRIVTAYIADIKNAAEEGAGKIDGTRLKEINSEIGKQARSNAGSDLGRYLNDLQDTIQEAVAHNASPEDVAALRDFRRQYAYGKVVEPLVAKTIDGKVSPQGLMARVTATKAGKHFMARSMGGPIGDLAKVGQLIKEPGSSLTTERGLIYGAGLGGAGYIEPHSAAAAYGSALAYNTLGPKLTRAMVGKKAKPAPKAPPAPPPEPTTSPGAGGPRGGGGGGGGGPGPLGDLTPDWKTTPGAGGGKPRGGHEPGLVRAVDETEPLPQGVPGKPGEQIPLHEPRPLGDLTPEWETTPGAGGGKRRGGEEPGLHRAAGEPPLPAGKRREKLEIPAVPGRPDLPDTVVAGRPSELVLDKRTQEALNEPGAIEARRKQTEAAEHARRAAEPRVPVGEVIEGQPEIKTSKEKIPVGKATEGQPEIKPFVPKKPIPKGEATELPVERIEPKAPIETGEVVDLTPEQEAAWRKEFGLNEPEAQRATAVAEALKHDEKAVEAAAVQHENSPRAFDREIERINEEAKNANESKPAAEGGESSAAAGGETKLDTAAAARAPGERAGADSAGATGERGAEGTAGGQAPHGVKALVKGPAVEIREVSGGFEAWRDGKKVGYLKDNLERGQAKQLGETANVDMVKLDKEEQGKGTGRALYKAFEEKHEGRIAPSGKTEPAAWKLWKRNYPEKVDAFVKQEAQRITDGADRGMVLGNIKDAEVAQRVNDAVAKIPPKPTPKAFASPIVKGMVEAAQASADDVGKTPEQLLADKVEHSARESARTIAEEAKTHDFAPSDLPQMIRHWAEEDKIPADDLRQAVLKALDKTDISDARKAQVVKALDLTKMQKPLVPKAKPAYDAVAHAKRSAQTAIDDHLSYEDSKASYRQNLIDTMDEHGVDLDTKEKALTAYDEEIKRLQTPSIVRVTNDPGEGKVYYVKLPGDKREFAINRGDNNLGGPTWMIDAGDHWSQGPSPSQNGYVSTHLGDTKAEALRNLADKVQAFDAQPGYKQGLKRGSAASTPPAVKPLVPKAADWDAQKSMDQFISDVRPKTQTGAAMRMALLKRDTNDVPLYKRIEDGERDASTLGRWGKDYADYLDAKRASEKPPELQTEAEFGAVQKAKAIEELAKESAKAQGGQMITGPFSAYKSKAEAIRETQAALEKARAAPPEKFASDHLAEINKAIAEGKTPSPENVKRYDLEASHGKRFQPDDLQPAAGEKAVQKGAAEEPPEEVFGAEKVAPEVTETPEFKQWFAKSEVTGEDGAPKRMYHATHVDTNPRTGESIGDFTVFDRFATKRIFGRESLDQIGSWFSDSGGEQGAGKYMGNAGAVYPVYLSIQKPWNVTFEGMWRRAQKLSGQPLDARPNAKSVAALDKWMDDNGIDGIRIRDNPDSKIGSTEFTGQDVWVARKPEQIKSAIGNRGTFDPNDPNILHSTSIEAQKQAVAGYKEGNLYGVKPLGSPEAVEAVLREKFGHKLIDGLHAQGLLKYALAMDEGMGTPDKRGVKAIFRQGSEEPPATTLYFDRLTADNAPGILMHELGEHFGAPRLLGLRYAGMMDELRTLAKTDPEVKAAWEHVERNYVGEGTAAKFESMDNPKAIREVAAHLVETQPDLPWVRRVINEVRAFFYEQFGTTMGNRVDANLVRGVAAAALRKASEGGLRGQRPTAAGFKPLVPSSRIPAPTRLQ